MNDLLKFLSLWVRNEFHRKEMSERQKKRFETSPGTFTGRKHTKETIELYKNDPRRIHFGNQHTKGKVWVTNGTIDKMCFSDIIPEGYTLGRTKNRKESNNARTKE